MKPLLFRGERGAGPALRAPIPTRAHPPRKGGGAFPSKAKHAGYCCSAGWLRRALRSERRALLFIAGFWAGPSPLISLTLAVCACIVHLYVYTRRILLRHCLLFVQLSLAASSSLA